MNPAYVMNHFKSNLASFTISLLFASLVTTASVAENGQRPNVLFLMADDLGYGDVGFNGNQIVNTPNLDKLAREGARFNRFYSIGTICAPTRATVMTGRHYSRIGMSTVNIGRLPKEEMTLAKVAKEKGYATGHFGKWHIGTLSKKHSNFRRGDDLSAVYAPPWERDFDESLVSESNLATWDPYDYTGLLEKKHHDIFYRNGKPVSSGMEGAVSRILVDHALLFIEQAVKEKKPFMSTIWFHAPHHPVRAGPKYLEMYKDLKEGQRHYYGCITALDEQVGRLRAELERLGVAENTLIFFCADNGPEGDGHPGEEHDLYLGSSYGQTGGLRGRKRWTYNGGVCVPAFAYWPGTIKGEQTIETPACTADYLSTLCALTGYNLPNNLPQDGEDIMPYLTGNRLSRYKAIGFSSIQGKGPPFSIIKDNYRLFTNLAENAGESDELYRLDDMAEETNIAAEHPELVARMKVELRAWYESCRNSYENGDYEGHVMMGEFPYIETVNAEKGK